MPTHTSRNQDTQIAEASRVAEIVTDLIAIIDELDAKIIERDEKIEQLEQALQEARNP